MTTDRAIEAAALEKVATRDEIEVLAKQRGPGIVPPTDTQDLMAAICEFEAALPGWWWSVCVCSLTRDASCGPDVTGPDRGLLVWREFDEGFHCDDDSGTLASSLRDVMRQALEAKARATEKDAT